MKNRRLWDTAHRLLADKTYFNTKRSEVLAAYPLLNSHGLGIPKGSGVKRTIASVRDLETLDQRESRNFEDARDELWAGGRCEQGIRNTLEYFVDGRVSLSYRLRGCSRPKNFNNPAPPRQSSYQLKHQVESFFGMKQRPSYGRRLSDSNSIDRYTANGAFICASLMVGLKIWTYRNSVNPDLRIGKPWAVAGLNPEDYVLQSDETMARFWRWVVQQDPKDQSMSDFISDTIDLLYDGASLQQLESAISKGCSEAQDIFEKLKVKLGVASDVVASGDSDSSYRIGFLEGQIRVPDDFNKMGAEEIENSFGAI